jgi:hypothetical protein
LGILPLLLTEAIVPKGNRPFVRCPDSYNLCVSTDFLDRLSTQLKANKSAPCRRAIQRILAVVKENFEDGKYKNHVEAEAEFRQLVNRDEGCK